MVVDQGILCEDHRKLSTRASDTEEASAVALPRLDALETQICGPPRLDALETQICDLTRRVDILGRRAEVGEGRSPQNNVPIVGLLEKVEY
ncbi:hypothetical protein NDU88_005550 [Pleurodeles waltl]|uniref:Uncharacterized protein n=1 Tax=Pleurodeles waltl TaxID=8319 RepID=A0AAV7WC46_PLEWA|nr:hypothetical protein NDU88_005550 [Pleurodeles waltl]